MAFLNNVFAVKKCVNTGISAKWYSVINKNFELHSFLLSDDGCVSFRLLSQLNEKERELQELLRISLRGKQDQIDALRKAVVIEGIVFLTIQYICI